jgi:hypothetical protein
MKEQPIDSSGALLANSSLKELAIDNGSSVGLAFSLETFTKKPFLVCYEETDTHVKRRLTFGIAMMDE